MDITHKYRIPAYLHYTPQIQKQINKKEGPSKDAENSLRKDVETWVGAVRRMGPVWGSGSKTDHITKQASPDTRYLKQLLASYMITIN